MTKADQLRAQKAASTDPARLEQMAREVERPVDRTALSYWFPLIEAAGLPVPRTKLFKMPADVQEFIWRGFDGKADGDELLNFAVHVAEETIAAGFRFPLFLRTDHTSGKHDWRRTCYVPMHEELSHHIFAIAEHSEMAGIIGLPWDTWAVRELLPTKPLGTCPLYGDMPVCREFRVFVDGADVRCVHPYWPLRALEDGGCSRLKGGYPALCALPYHDQGAVTALASAAGKACGGAWSVDVLDTERGWFVTDMAEAEKSFHWRGCQVPMRSAEVR